ncbi:MAG: cellulase family glycosylhydrolase [FCB group bacterium]|nr:cellulase family glycosylhydrolase [FCB group bacterium]
MKVWLFTLSVLLCQLTVSCDKKSLTDADIDIIFTPQEAAALMPRGINLGNTLEPDTEGGWNNGPAQEYYFEDYANAGFDCVRIPVKWGSHTGENQPFDVEASWLDRVEEVVNWGLEQDLFIIINGHHEDWLKAVYSPFNVARYERIWEQIADRFRDKSHRLLFEIINEPQGLTIEQTDDINARILPIIRETNPTRIVIFGGAGWSSRNDMMTAAIPEDDYLMAYFHQYDPWNFAGLGNGTWGSTADRNTIASNFEQAAGWSLENNIPVMISEFGAVHICDYNSRMLHYYTYVEEALKNNIAFQVWDDGGNFGIYDRENRTWPEEKNILLNTYPQGPNGLETALLENGTIILTWENRTSENTGVRVERRTDDTEYSEIAQLGADVTVFEDTSVHDSGYYYYRVISEMSGQPDMYSYPVKRSEYELPAHRQPFSGSPIQIPGTIQAEDFDIGGESWTYHDLDDVNTPGAYRPWEAVDIELRDDGGYQVTDIESGEWLEFTILAAESRMYEITVYTASMDGGGQLRFQLASSFSGVVDIPATNSWQILTAVSTSMSLPQGEHFLKLHFVSEGPYNLDRIEIQ